MAAQGTAPTDALPPTKAIAAALREQAARLDDDALRDLALRSATRWDGAPDGGPADLSPDLTHVSLTRKERNLLAREISLRLPEEGKHLADDGGPVGLCAPASVISRYSALWKALGAKRKIKRRDAEQRHWEVPAAVLSPALLHLRERRRDEERAIFDALDGRLEETAAARRSEVADRVTLTNVQEVLLGLGRIDAKVRSVEGGRS